MLRHEKNNLNVTIEEFREDITAAINSILLNYFKDASQFESLQKQIRKLFDDFLKNLNADHFAIQFYNTLDTLHTLLLESNFPDLQLYQDIKKYYESIKGFVKQHEPVIISKNDFKWDSDEQKAQEWKYAEERLRVKGRLAPDGTKLSRKEPNSPLKHSYIVINRRIIVIGSKKNNCIDAIKRNDRAIKLGEDLTGSWALKIFKWRQAIIQEEVDKTIDLGMALPPVQREKNKNFKTYLATVYAGITLREYLTKELSDEEYLDIAIGMLAAVLHLHSGQHSISDTKYKHNDFHLGNVTIDKNGKIHLIDFDRASVNSTREAVSVISTVRSIFPDRFRIDQRELYDYLYSVVPDCSISKFHQDLITFKQKIFSSKLKP